MEAVMGNVNNSDDNKEINKMWNEGSGACFLESEPIREFTMSESVFAWICIIFGYLFCRVFPVVSSPFGGFIFIVVLFAGTTVVFKVKKSKLGIVAIVSGISAILVSAALVFSSNGMLHFFAYVYALATYLFYIHRAMGNCTERGFSDLIILDYFKALFILPFRSSNQLFKAMFYGKANESGRFIGRMLLGIALAVIPTGIVIGLLSYDNNFSTIISGMFDFSSENIFSHMVSLGLAIPIADYLFGAFVSSVDKKNDTMLDAEECREKIEDLKIAPVVTVLVAVIPLLFVYVIFFISQWEYFLSGFTGKLPDGFSYAQYAREGFFQLCTVSVINLIVILAVVFFMNSGKKYAGVILKSLTMVFSVFTLILISTAIAKMVLYIECYGLTPKRVYSTWFMMVLTAVFILIIVKQFVPKLNTVAASMVVFIVMFALLALFNVDGFIARYNIDRYLDGTLEKLDVHALAELGDAAVPEMVRLAEEFDRVYHADIAEINNSYETKDIVYYRLAIELRTIAEEFEEENKDFFSYTVPYIKAKQSLESIGLIN